jgi:septal ring factor EnvC (AmiA/AmiB activator)
LDGTIKHLEEQLRAISVELEAKKADNLGLVAQRDKDRDLVELMKANEDKLNELLAKEKMTVTNLKKSLQTRDDEISSLKANNDRFIEEREDMPITKRVFSSMMNECEYFYIE